MSSGASPLLKVDGLSAGYGTVQILANVSLEVHAGESVALLGCNGAGKTTFIRALAGMVSASSTGVAFNGTDIAGLSTDQICEHGLIQVPEGRQIFPSQTVETNLRLGGLLKRARRQAADTLEHVYSRLPRLRERRKQLAGTLSGGEQQMLAIGRAIMAQPVLMMLDEPSLGLSPLMVEEMFKIVSELSAGGMSILVVEQNVIESLNLCQRAYVLENGGIVMHGSSSELLADDRVRQAYLGL